MAIETSYLPFNITLTLVIVVLYSYLYYLYCIKNETQMKKQFIPYKEALALKKLGFDEPCLARFIDEETLIIDDSVLTMTQCRDFNFMCLAPLYQQAIGFFREKYNLYGIVAPRFNADGTICHVYEAIKPTFENEEAINVNLFNGIFFTYQSHKEAQLACIRVLIKIVINEQK